jgi:hypothetical protein
LPDIITFDIIPESDYFILLSTDGLFQSMNISHIVKFHLLKYRLNLLWKDIISYKFNKVLISY